jgi:Catalase
MTQDQAPPTTTDAGIPVESNEHSLTVGPDGPILLQDHYLIEQMAQFNRERLPERQPHAKGSGAFGRFEVTNDVSAYTKAAMFQPGVKTDLLARFSTVAGERGSPDTWRDPRGVAVKFYTDEGNEAGVRLGVLATITFPANRHRPAKTTHLVFGGCWEPVGCQNWVIAGHLRFHAAVTPTSGGPHRTTR